MRTYEIRLMDYFDSLNDVKRYVNMLILFNGGAISSFGGDSVASKFILQNPDMFMIKPIEPDNIPSSGKWLLCNIVKLSTFQIVCNNLKRLIG